MNFRSFLLIIMVGLIATALSCTTAQQATSTAAPRATTAPGTPAPAATATRPAAPTATVVSKLRPKLGGTLRVGGQSDISSLDPASHLAWETRAAFFVYDMLININETTYEIEPELAESWTIAPDGKSITFKLRRGVKFHDGTDFNAEAAKFHFDRMLSPANTSSVMKNDLVSVDSFDKIDDYTIRVNLKYPQSAILYLLASNAGAIVSPAGVKKWGDEYRRHPVGTGPFEFVEWVQGDHLTLKKFAGYYKKDVFGNQLPYVDSVNIKPVTDDSVRLINLKTGVLDLIEEIPPKDIAATKADKTLKYLAVDSAGNLQTYMNFVKPPFDNKACREAVEHAIDREALLRVLYFGEGKVSESMVAPGHYLYDPTIKSRAFDLAKAKEKLAECGKPDGFEATAYVPTLPIHTQRAEMIQAMLAKVGIKLTIKPEAVPQLITRVVANDYEQFLFLYYGGFPDYDRLTVDWYSKSPRFQSWAQMGAKPLPGYDEAYEKQRASYDRAERKKAYAELQKAFNDFRPYFTFIHPPKNIVAKAEVEGYTVGTDVSMKLETVWFNK